MSQFQESVRGFAGSSTRGLIGSAAMLGLVVLVILFGPSAPSYFRAAVAVLRDDVQEAVPVAVELKRATEPVNELKAMEPELKGNIAKLQAAGADLRADIATREAGIAGEEKDIFKLRDDLESDQPLVYGGRTFTRAEVESDLVRRWSAYQRDQAHLAGIRERLTVLEGLIEESLRAWTDLVVEINRLEVEIDDLTVRDETADLILRSRRLTGADPLTVNRAREILAKVRTAVTAKELNTKDPLRVGEIPVSGGFAQQLAEIDRFRAAKE